MSAPVAGRLRTALDDFFADGAPGAVAVAVSGGGDSTALLLASLDYGREQGVVVRAVTVDHGLRAESADEARRVAALCASHDCPHETLALDGFEPGPDLQARARAARYDALEAWGRRNEMGVILLGHTADDVAETLLMRLRRGAGIDGLARMAGRFGAAPAFGRPFLRLERDTLRRHLAECGVAPIEDPSNDDAAFERVRVRQAIAAFDLDSSALARTAGFLDDARRSLARRAADLAAGIVTEDRGDLLFDRPALLDLIENEREQARRLLLAALRCIGGDGYPPRTGEIDRLLAALPDGGVRTLGGCVLWPVAEGRLRVAREAAATAPPVPVGEVWDGRWCLDGPVGPGLAIGALGPDVAATPWRESGLPRRSLLASPAIRDSDGALVAAPLAGLSAGWRATPRRAFTATLISR
ncbi:tRNA lysidine(34) synthetase TilS [uncultured Jannaschia sp.]|uniref:tRNA lysidine(34) synthetase TilS n=1 Tax=uncultured Jannaschia sp. TaxID=293347 RepID=UPI002624D653|nr:tRNA lysidine(34) synthetase TilS [uncultured Jannaschia sp.]